MISLVKGTVVSRKNDHCILLAGSVGYRIFATIDTVAHLEDGTETTLFTHLAVRENALDLYGFRNEAERDFFELLLSVSGIGPKSALNIMGLASIDTLRSAIHSGDAAHLSKVSGIGRKTAEKIVLELHEKIGASGLPEASTHADSDTLEALHALGYSLSEARETLRRIPQDVSGSNERLREALKLLGK